MEVAADKGCSASLEIARATLNAAVSRVEACEEVSCRPVAFF